MMDGSRIGVDGRTISTAKIRKIKQCLERKSIVYITDFDPISELWTDRPDMPDSVAYDFPVIYSGKERAIKIAERQGTDEDKKNRLSPSDSHG